MWIPINKGRQQWWGHNFYISSGNNHSNASEIARERLAYNQTVESPLTRQEALDDTGEFEVMVDPPSREVMDTHGDEGNIYDNEGNIYGNEVRLCRPVKVQNLANHIQDMKNQSYAFKHDFNVRGDPGIILGILGSANERRCYIVTPPPIGWASIENDPWRSNTIEVTNFYETLVDSNRFSYVKCTPWNKFYCA